MDGCVLLSVVVINDYNVTMYLLQNGGWCAASANAQQTYQRYGRSEACLADGEGGPRANEVYKIVTGEFVKLFEILHVLSKLSVTDNESPLTTYYNSIMEKLNFVNSRN